MRATPAIICAACGHALIAEPPAPCPECGSTDRISGLLPPKAKRVALLIRFALVPIAVGMIAATLRRDKGSSTVWILAAIVGVTIIAPAVVFGASNLYSHVRLKSAIAWGSIGFALVSLPVYMRLTLRFHYPSKLAGWTTEPLTEALPDVLGWLAVGVVIATAASILGPTLAAAARRNSA